MQKMARTVEARPELTDAALLKVFQLLPAEHRRKLPSVCRKWRRICSKHEELWAHVQVSLGPDFLRTVDLAALYDWFLRRQDVVRHLDVEIGSADAWTVIHGVLGIVGRRVQHLRIYSDREACYEAGGRAAWMALAPGLASLELENAADWTIGTCHFPKGLTHLDLSYCGEEGLTALPDHLSQLQSLASLSLQGSQLDGQADFSALQHCSLLQCLNLTDCCLEEVPRCLSSLAASLTYLNLNSNSDLGGEGQAGRLAALASLTRLQQLEMRECGLINIPEGVVQLSSLHTMLLGLNDLALAPPFVLPGPYLASLRMLGLSDCGLGEDSEGGGFLGAGALETEEEEEDREGGWAAIGNGAGDRAQQQQQTQQLGGARQASPAQAAVRTAAAAGASASKSTDAPADQLRLEGDPYSSTAGRGTAPTAAAVVEGSRDRHGPKQAAQLMEEEEDDDQEVQSACALDQLAAELEGATALEVLRINRNLAMRLTVPGITALLRNKPHFRRLEFSEDMAGPGLDLAALSAQFRGVSFRAVD